MKTVDTIARVRRAFHVQGWPLKRFKVAHVRLCHSGARQSIPSNSMATCAGVSAAAVPPSSHRAVTV